MSCSPKYIGLRIKRCTERRSSSVVTFR
jgi:hypothetical protein